MEAPLVPVQLTPERMQSIGVKTGTVEYKQLNDDIRATGTVDINERLLSYVQVRFPGYIRKVFANATYQYVRKGEPLFTIYSPDLVATQQEYLLARQNQKTLGASTVDGVASGAESLSAAAEQRLQQWEVPQSEIAKLKETGKPVTDLTINSPVSGYITERNALPNMYAEPSTKLYTVADLSRVWVYAQVFQNDIGRIKPGDAAQITVDSYPGRTFSRSDRRDPAASGYDNAHRPCAAGDRESRAQAEAGHVRQCRSENQSRPPARRPCIGGLPVRHTTTGFPRSRQRQSGAERSHCSVLASAMTSSCSKGLQPHQSIVTSANFLIDSESQLQAAAGSFVPPPPGAGGNARTGKCACCCAGEHRFHDRSQSSAKGQQCLSRETDRAGGAPITGAEVTVTFYMAAMPAMGMAAMNTTAKLTDKGDGLYEGSGSLGSGGTWQVTITVQKNGQVIATKQLRVNATGGM